VADADANDSTALLGATADEAGGELDAELQADSAMTTATATTGAALDLCPRSLTAEIMRRDPRDRVSAAPPIGTQQGRPYPRVSRVIAQESRPIGTFLGNTRSGS
jgi:hypothetical protein